MILGHKSDRPAVMAGRFFFAILLSLLIAAPSYSHGDNSALTHTERPARSKIRVVLDPLPAALQGLHVEIRRTLAPQLLVNNPTGRKLLIEDDNGRAFLRIGPEHVEGDLGAAAFHRSNTLMAPSSIAADASEQPRWRMVEKKPNWGWFDLRLRSDAVSVPHAVVDAGKPASVGQWSIPVRLGDTRSALKGHFQYEPPPRGIAEARVEDRGELSDKAVVRALTGSRLPGMFVSYRGDEPLTILGIEQEPFLRFDDDGVAINRHSVTWKSITPAGAPGYVKADPNAEPLWATLSPGNSYGWIEPRAATSKTVDNPNQSSVLKHWQIPVLIGQQRSRIKGVTEWQPITPRSQAAKQTARNN